MERLAQAIAVLSKKEAFECLQGGVPAAAIATYEQQLGLTFPDNYRWFLSTFGYVSWFGHSILGYSPHDPDYDTLVATKRSRATKLPKGFLPLPRNGNIVMRYGGGGDYVLFSKGGELEGQVVLYTDEYGGRPTDSWSSFEAFVEHFSRF